MTRYQVLRCMGCDPLTAGTIAFFNWLRGAPDGLIFFMHMVIEYNEETHHAQ